jgi:hypothetical protein
LEENPEMVDIPESKLNKHIPHIRDHVKKLLSHTLRMKIKKSALNGGMPLYKFIGNIFLTNFFNFLHNTNFTDCHTGYWVYNLRKIKSNWITKFSSGFLFDLDMRLELLKQKLSIKEIFIITRYGSERSSVHLNYAIFFFIKTLTSKIFK